MTLALTQRDEEMLRGRFGPAPRMAMNILVRMAEVDGAEELMDISRVHIDGALYLGESSLDFAETFATLGSRVSVPTTLNMGPIDEYGWRDFPVPPEYAEKCLRIMHAYVRMGCDPTWTCAPYQVGVRPAFGEQIVWAESNAIVFANSVLGARTNRYGDYVDLCAAITGRAPKSGLHLTENRKGQILFRLKGLPSALLREDSFYPVLGFFMGERAGTKVPVIEGLPKEVTEDQLKALGAAAASSGRVALFHAVGITPEAPTLATAMHGQQPELVVDVVLSKLRECRDRMSTDAPEELDMVVLGCPHFSIAEFQQLASLTGGLDRHPGVTVLIITNRYVRDQLRGSETWAELERFGVKIAVDCCNLHMPTLTPDIKVIMSNSGKQCYYAPGILDRMVVFGSLNDCVRSAAAGKVIREDSLWND